MTEFAISAAMPPDLTPAVAYLRGEYALWSYRIPYLSVVLPMSFVEDKFSLVDEIPESERVEWTVNELFQRDISWERIDNELVRYLRNDSRPQFFNALTVALLPKENHGLASKYEQGELIEPLSDSTLAAPVQIGGIQIHPYKGSDNTAGKIRWDENRVIAVAVDGQHRLAAIKRVKTHIAADRFSSSSVPVIFLIPDEKFGYVEPDQPTSENRILSSLRRIFIDLNKHAKSVSRARNILLDEQDIYAICTRSLLGTKLTASIETDRIPLALVDWISEKNKFESGPFLSTVLLLNDLVKTIIDQFPEPREERDPKVERWLRIAFEPTEEELEELMTQVMRCFNQEIPTTFKQGQLETLKDRFEKRWRHLLYRMISEFKPYRELWEYGKQHGLHAPQFVNLYIAKEILKGEYADKRQDEIIASNQFNDPDWTLKKGYLEPLKKIDEQMKNNSWAFKVVFQRAFFDSFSTLLLQREEFSEEYVGEDGRDKFLLAWLEAMNAFYDAGFANTKLKCGGEEFWRGIGKNAEGTIEYTMVGSARIQKWLNAWVFMYWTDAETIPTFDQLHNYDSGLMKLCRKSLHDDRVTAGMKKLLSARGEIFEDEAAEKKAVTDLAKKRYNLFRKTLKSL